MKKYFLVVVGSALVVSVLVILQKAQAQGASSQVTEKTGAMMSGAGGTGGQEIPTVTVTEVPAGYRDWKLISVAREAGALDDIRAVLGNDIAVQAYRQGTRPFPEGAIIARIAWSYDASEENNKIFGKAQSFVAGRPKNGVQFMVKDSKKYASTGGWGYGQFDDGQAASASMLQSCYKN
jgi:hypothetical protein